MPIQRRRIKITQLATPLKSTGAQYGERLKLAVRICWFIVLAGFILYKLYEFLGHVAAFTAALIGAIFFAYLIFPIVSRLNRRMPLGVAIGIVYASLALLVALVLLVVAPALSADFQQLVHNGPALVHQAQAELTNPTNPFVQRLPLQVRDYIATLPAQIENNLGLYASTFTTTVLPVVASIVALGALFVVIPVVATYLLLEAEDIKRTFLGFIPNHNQEKAQQVIADLDGVVGGFVRGQIVVAFIVGLLVTLLLLGLHVQYAVLIGALAGVFDVIPYVGAVAGWLPAFFIALFTNGSESALFVTIGIIAINQLEGHIIAPLVVSKSVELTPLTVLLALIAGGALAGIPGLFLAVPVAGAIRVLVVDLRPPPATVTEAKPALKKRPKKPPLIRRIIAAIDAQRHRSTKKGSHHP